jgi:hypothetical protein
VSAAQIVVRLNPTEQERVARVLARLRQNDPRLTLSAIIRALLVRLDDGTIAL